VTNKNEEAFSFSKGSIKAIELLNESVLNKIFTDTCVPKDDILLVYLIYFQLINHKLFKKIENKNIFWNHCCKYFINEGNGKTGNQFNNFI
jgi:hypothetical protein